MGRPAARLGSLKPKLVAKEHRTLLPRPKTGDPETKTRAFEAWRKQVLDNAGWKCQAPGCGAQGGRGGVMLYADHIKERRDGGNLLDPKNGQALCASHHTKKTAAERMKRHSDRHSPGSD
jgi:hypothetical protein